MKGELDRSLEYYHRARSFNIGRPSHIPSHILLNLGQIHQQKGDLDLALDYFEQSLTQFKSVEITSIGVSNSIAHTLAAMANIYRFKGELNQAKELYQQSLSLHEEQKFESGTWTTLFGLFQVALEQQDSELAHNCAQQLQTLDEGINTKLTHLYRQMAEALLLKTSLRARQRGQAQTLLEQLLKEDVIDYTLTALAISHLSELLLDEYQHYGDQAVITEFQQLLEQLYELGQTNHNYGLIIEALILKAKLPMVKGEFEQASKYLETATILADEKELTLLQDKVALEIQQLQSNFVEMEEIINRNIPMQKRIRHVNLNKYITEARKTISLHSTTIDRD